MKKRSETQTLHAGCNKAEPKIYRPAADGHYLYLQTQFGEDQCTQFRVIVVTDPQTHPQTGPITIHCAEAS